VTSKTPADAGVGAAQEQRAAGRVAQHLAVAVDGAELPACRAWSATSSGEEANAEERGQATHPRSLA